MASSSSTLSSESGSCVLPARDLFRRLAWFVAPYCTVAVVLALLVLRTGELLPARFVAWLMNGPVTFVYLDEFSDHSFQFKLESTRLRRPEVLAIGGSRMNQWRSAMFKPYEFFNASNCLYTQHDYRRFLEGLGDYAPRVLVFSLDFYTFNPDYDAFFERVSFSDMDGFGSSEQTGIARRLFGRARADPTVLLPTQREPLHGVPALGLHAAETGTGFRRDGSYQYGAVILGRPDSGAASIDNAVARVDNGSVPLLRAAHLDQDRRRELERFAAAARQKGIKLVAITMPYTPRVKQALDRSSQHGIWREFQNDETARWIRQQGVIYFNFSDLESFGGKPDEFVDPFHPSETAYSRMLQVMLQNPDFAAILPGVSRESIEQRMDKATQFEVYFNEF
jgi:hypothetical protein